MARDSSYRMPTVTFAAMSDVSMDIAKRLQAGTSWKELKEEILQEGLMPQKSLSGRKRVLNEIHYRLQHLHPEEMELLSNTELSTGRLLIHLAACRAYPFLMELMIQVLREKILVHDLILQVYEFERFWEQEAQTHPEVDRLGIVSKNQIRRAVYRFLVEVGILESVKQPNLQTPWVSKELGEILKNDDLGWLKLFLLTDKQIKELSKE